MRPQDCEQIKRTLTAEMFCSTQRWNSATNHAVSPATVFEQVAQLPAFANAGKVRLVSLTASGNSVALTAVWHCLRYVVHHARAPGMPKSTSATHLLQVHADQNSPCPYPFGVRYRFPTMYSMDAELVASTAARAALRRNSIRR
jgi:hypothetical protein